MTSRRGPDDVTLPCPRNPSSDGGPSPSRSIFDRVPDEVLDRIVRHLSVLDVDRGIGGRMLRADLAHEAAEAGLRGLTALGCLMRTSKRLNALALPVLYNDMVVRDLVQYSRSLAAGFQARLGGAQPAVGAQLAGACARTRTLTLLDAHPHDRVYTPETTRAALTSIKLLDAALRRCPEPEPEPKTPDRSQTDQGKEDRVQAEQGKSTCIFPALEHVVVRQLPERDPAMDRDGLPGTRSGTERGQSGFNQVVYFGVRYQQARQVQDALLDLVQQLKPQSCCSYALKTPGKGYPQGLMLPAMIDWTDWPSPVVGAHNQAPAPAPAPLSATPGGAQRTTDSSVAQIVVETPPSTPLLVCHYSPGSAIFVAAGTRVVYDPMLADPTRGASPNEVEAMFETINEVLATFESYIVWTWNPRMRRPPPMMQAEVRVPLIDVSASVEENGLATGKDNTAVEGGNGVDKWMVSKAVQAGLVRPSVFYEEWAAARHRAVQRFDEGCTTPDDRHAASGTTGLDHSSITKVTTRSRCRTILQGFADLTDGRSTSTPGMESVVVYAALRSFTTAYIRQKVSGMLLGTSGRGTEGWEAMCVDVSSGSVCGCGGGEAASGSGQGRGTGRGDERLSANDVEALDLLARRGYL